MLPTDTNNIDIYFVQCFFDTNKLNNISELRDEHQAYIRQHIDIIRYGGIIFDDDLNYKLICLFVLIDNEEKARAFANNDPYASAYYKIDVSKFTQKIPVNQS
jgi:uncharacterized protein YciI